MKPANGKSQFSGRYCLDAFCLVVFHIINIKQQKKAIIIVVSKVLLKGDGT